MARSSLDVSDIPSRPAISINQISWSNCHESFGDRRVSGMRGAGGKRARAKFECCARKRGSPAFGIRAGTLYSLTVPSVAQNN